MSKQQEFDHINSLIDEMNYLIENDDKEEMYDVLSEVSNLYSAEIPGLKELFEDSAANGGLLARNTRTASALLSKYIRSTPVVSDLFNSTLEALEPYTEARKSYESVKLLFNEDPLTRNVLDNMRFSFEVLIKEMFSTNKTLEHSIKVLRGRFKEDKTPAYICDMFFSIYNFYFNYQNDCVKHNDNIRKEDVEFVIEQTSIMMKYLINKFGGINPDEIPVQNTAISD